MPRRRRDDDDSQVSFAWADAKRILEGAPAGEVIFEAPELRPRRRKAVPRSPVTPGLPFGVRQVDGTPACWSCGQPVSEETVVRVGPGDHRCPGCGAKLPFL